MKGLPPKPPSSDETLPRRDFLRSAGYTLAVAASSCSRLPVEEAIPYLVPPEAHAAGEPLHYATVCKACPAGCGVLATCLDGRPVKLEGNPDHPISRGGLCAAGQASVLDLYDPKRLREPQVNGTGMAWPEVDSLVRTGLAEAARTGRRVVVLSSTRNSPLEKTAVRRFLSRFPSSQWVVYDPVPADAVVGAHRLTHGVAALPSYRLDRVECMVGVGADFLGTWISPVEFAQAYRDSRMLEGSRLRYSYHVQFEAYPTLTGSRADRRHTAGPDLQLRILLRLALLLGGAEARRAGLPDPGELGHLDQELTSLAKRLQAGRGRSLVLCGLESIPAQVLTNYLNQLLGAYDRTVDLAYPSFQREGCSQNLWTLLEGLERGEVGAILVLGSNPVYDLPFGDHLARLMSRVPLGISFSPLPDETSAVLSCRCPEPHFLEAWGDSEPNARTVAVQQPCIRRLGNSRTVAESLAAWSGEAGSDYDLLRRLWAEVLHPRQVGVDDFEAFWSGSLAKGMAPVRPVRHEAGGFRPESLQAVKLPESQPGIQVLLRPDVRFPSVAQAVNPWLQELPDPLTRQVWGNALEVGPDLAERLGLRDGDVVRLATSDAEVRAPVLIQPGISAGCAVIALGHGAQAAADLSLRGPRHRGRPARSLADSVRASRLAQWREGSLQHVIAGATLKPTGERAPLALAQLEDSASPPDPLSSRPRELGLVQEVNLEELLAARPAPPTMRASKLWGQVGAPPPGTPRWGMVIDLGACTGCGACVIACQAENNIPVAGPDESRRRRFLHWLRIDRYVSGPAGDPRFHFLPLPCQHCAHAPCEVVCPVAATVRSEDGINVQVYNRCIGTRYCANNCPWKVRSFNWFDYPREGMETLQLNPGVTVRSRGVMEKCSLCIQRIQAVRLNARVAGRDVADGEIQPACAQTCPSRAIVFGDLNDPRSLLSRLVSSPRAYRLLEWLGTEPSVFYLKRVINQPLEGTG